MAIQPTNLARVCTAKRQPLWAKINAHTYCQIFVSPYNWDTMFYYNKKWIELGEEDIMVYEWANWRNYNEETDWKAIQYSNKVIKDNEPSPTINEPDDIIAVIQNSLATYNLDELKDLIEIAWEDDDMIIPVTLNYWWIIYYHVLIQM